MSSSSNARPIRVLWLAKGLGPGGMEGLLVSQARTGDRSKYEYSAAYLIERPNSVVPKLRDLGVECTQLGSGRGRDITWVRALRRYVKQREIDIVHTHSPFVAALARPALRAMRRRPKLIYTEHNSWYSYGRATRVMNAATYPLDDIQLSVSHAAVDSMPPRFRRGISVLTHGIDLEEVRSFRGERDAARAELGITDDQFIALTVANLRVEKAYDVLLDTARVVIDRHPEVVFLSVGQGPLLGELTARHSELSLGDSFRFLGFRDDVPRLLAAADAFVLSSRSEGLPLGLMEACAIGVAPVVTNVGGMPDHIHDGQNGRVVEPESPEALAEAIGSIVVDPQLRKTFADGARQAADAFDASTAVGQIESAYEKVVS